MKKLLILPVLLLATLALAVNFQLTWEASPTPAVTQYRVYSSTNDFNLTNAVWTLLQTVEAVPGTNFSWLSNLSAPPIRSIAVSATDTNGGESVKLAAPVLFAPRNLTIREVP